MQRFGTILTLLAAVVGAWVAPGLGQSADARDQDKGGFVVAVNPANDYGGKRDEMIGMVKRLYLKERNAWPGDTEASPFGRPEDSAEHKAFIKSVLGMSQAELARHWIAVKQKTGQTPPRDVGSDTMLGKLIAKYPGALGVMTAEAAEKAGDDVKVLFRFD